MKMNEKFEKAFIRIFIFSATVVVTPLKRQWEIELCCPHDM